MKFLKVVSVTPISCMDPPSLSLLALHVTRDYVVEDRHL